MLLPDLAENMQGYNRTNSTRAPCQVGVPTLTCTRFVLFYQICPHLMPFLFPALNSQPGGCAWPDHCWPRFVPQLCLLMELVFPALHTPFLVALSILLCHMEWAAVSSSSALPGAPHSGSSPEGQEQLSCCCRRCLGWVDGSQQGRDNVPVLQGTAGMWH